MRMILYGDPRTKKNSPRLFVRGRRACMLPSKAYCDYEKACIEQIHESQKLKLNYRMNLQAVYYMKTHRDVDLGNLLAATCDILVKAGVLEDDNVKIVATHDGSNVFYDKELPRVEITMTEKEK